MSALCLIFPCHSARTMHNHNHNCRRYLYTHDSISGCRLRIQTTRRSKRALPYVAMGVHKKTKWRHHSRAMLLVCTVSVMSPITFRLNATDDRFSLYRRRHKKVGNIHTRTQCTEYSLCWQNHRCSHNILCSSILNTRMVSNGYVCNV